MSGCSASEIIIRSESPVLHVRLRTAIYSSLSIILGPKVD